MKRELAWGLVLLLAACGGGGGGGGSSDDGEDGLPVVTPPGAPEGFQAQQSIGPAGGTVSSFDGRLSLTVPPGALASATNIGIQTIGNNAPGGLGTGFRLTPDGQTFAQPVTLHYTPAAGELGSANGAGLGLAFQAADGTWQIVPGVADENADGTFTATTTHFTDYSFWQDVTIRGTNAQSNRTAGFVNSVFNLEVARLSPPAPNAGGFMALTGTYTTYTDNNCCTWAVNGDPALGGGPAGDLAPLGALATYTAPEHLPPSGQNPVAVTATFTLPDNSQITLVRTIHLLAHQYQIALTLEENARCLPGDAPLAPAYTFTSTANVLLTLDNDFNITGSGFNVLNPPPEVAGLTTCDPGQFTAQWLSDQTHDTTVTAATGGYSEARQKLHFALTGEWSDTPPLRITTTNPPPQSFDTSENRSSLAQLGLTGLFHFDGYDGEVVSQAFSAAGNRNSTEYGYAVTVTQE